jgi:hypothetical protein
MDKDAKKVSVPLSRVFRVSAKVFRLLFKKTKNPAEAYLVLRVLSMWLEEEYGVRSDSIHEAELRALVKDAMKDKDDERHHQIGRR